MLRVTKPIKVGVVGLGYFGAHHARQYSLNSSARLVAVADNDMARASAAAEIYAAEAFADYRGMIGKVDAVSIAAPTPAHAAIAADLIEAGIHVLIEKPITDDVASAADLVARAKRKNVVLQVGHIERFSPAFGRLKAEVRSPYFIECVRRGPWNERAAEVDVVLDLMIHDIDLALTLAGSQIVAVEASGAQIVSGTNDVAEARLTFANGVVAKLMASRLVTKSERTISVAVPGGYLIADLAAPSFTAIRRAAAIGAGAPDRVAAETIPLAPADNLAAEIAAFLDTVGGETPPVVDGKAGLDALRVADRILASIAKRGRLAPQPLERRA